MIKESRRWKKGINLGLILTALSLLIGSSLQAVEITINPEKPSAQTEFKITIIDVTPNSNLVLKMTSREHGTSEHAITWDDQKTGTVLLTDFSKGFYFASLSDSTRPTDKPLRVKAFIVGAK